MRVTPRKSSSKCKQNKVANNNFLPEPVGHRERVKMWLDSSEDFNFVHEMRSEPGYLVIDDNSCIPCLPRWVIREQLKNEVLKAKTNTTSVQTLSTKDDKKKKIVKQKQWLRPEKETVIVTVSQLSQSCRT